MIKRIFGVCDSSEWRTRNATTCTVLIFESIQSNMPCLRRVILSATLLALCSSFLLAQNPQLQTKNGRRFPTVVFTSVLWNAHPPYYTIAVDSIGSATYQSSPNSVDSTGVPYTLVFQANDSTRRMIFNVARNLDYFGDDIPVKVNSPQSGPIRTLAYRDLTFNNLITYSECSNSEIDELTSIFEEVSATAEFGRILTYLRQNDKDGVAAELATMQKEAERHHLRELQAIAPVLRSIASDNKSSEDARTRARALLTSVR